MRNTSVPYMGGSLGTRFNAFVKRLETSGWEYLDFGSFREVYVRDSMVIKVPVNGDGLIDNMVEAAAWRKYRNRPTRDGLQLAPCRLLPNGCLMMVRVNEDFYHSLPYWAENVDARQVGMYKGRFVAFDYAMNLSERKVWEQQWGQRSEYYHNTWLREHPHPETPYEQRLLSTG